MEMASNYSLREISILEEPVLLATRGGSQKGKVNLKDSILAQLSQLKIIVEEPDGHDDWKQHYPTSQQEVQKYQKHTVEQTQVIAEQAKTIQTLGQTHMGCEKGLVKERDSVLEGLEREKQARQSNSLGGLQKEKIHGSI